MARKPDPQDDDPFADASRMAGTVRESAQQIWLAGLGAFSKAQQEGGKVFEALVKEGATLQRRTQSVAEDRLAKAADRMTSMASELSGKASGQWDKLEGIFEERVSRALGKLGVPTTRDIDALAARIDELQRTVASLRAAGTRAAARPATAKAAARKRATPRKPG